MYHNIERKQRDFDTEDIDDSYTIGSQDVGDHLFSSGFVKSVANARINSHISFSILDRLALKSGREDIIEEDWNEEEKAKEEDEEKSELFLEEDFIEQMKKLKEEWCEGQISVNFDEEGIEHHRNERIESN
jgi:hypothetical protein